MKGPETRSFLTRKIAAFTVEGFHHRSNAISVFKSTANRLIAEEVLRQLSIPVGMKAIGIFTSYDGRTEIIVQDNPNFRNPEDPHQVQLVIGKPHARNDRDSSGNPEAGEPRFIEASPEEPEPLIKALLEKLVPIAT